MGEADAAKREYHPGRQFLVALEASGGDRVADRFFDFALRGDADLLEKSAQAGVETILVHDGLLMLWPDRIVQHLLGEISLGTVGARVGIAALDVAVLAA